MLVARNQPSPGNPRLVEGHVIVSLKERIEDSQALDQLDEQGYELIEKFDFREENFPGFGGDMVMLGIPAGLSTDEALEQLASDPRIDFVEAEQEFDLAETRKPDDLAWGLWGLNNTGGWGEEDADIDAPEAWTRTVGSRTDGPVIAVLDTGIDLDHPDLAANLWVNPGEIPGDGIDNDRNGVVDDVHGYHAYAKHGNPEDVDGHGTHCAGTIGAVGNNGEGVVGVNWNAQIMTVKIFNDNEEKPKTSTSAILRGIAYATNNGARITSNSWGGGWPSRSVKKAFRRSPAIHFMAAGNDSRDNDDRNYYPAGYRTANSVSVAASDRWDKLSSFSNWGKEKVDLAAPGTGIYSTVPDGYGYKSGTSMATPHAAGVAGLMLTLDPSLTNAEVKEHMLGSVDPTEDLQDKVATGGRLNAAQALESVASSSD